MYVDPDENVEKKRAEFREEIKRNKAVRKHYSDYSDADVESLIDGYALAKARLKVQGNYTTFHHEKLLKEWTGRAWFALCEIQHKKLFDMQCYWRAGEIASLPLIKWSEHFESLPVPILDYEALPDISPQEIDDYIRFLKTPQGEVHIRYSTAEYQNHRSIKESYGSEGGFIPEYYEYHNMLSGNSRLLSLPDMRKEEEDRLFHIALEYNRKQNQKKEASAPPVPQTKYLQRNDDEEIVLAGLLGEKDVAAFIKDLAKWIKEKPDSETDWAMGYLGSCYPEDVPMPAALRWQDALEKAALQHITLKLQETLPVIYEEYQMKKQLGTPIGDVTGDMKYRDLRNFLLQMFDLGEKLDKGEEILPDDIFE